MKRLILAAACAALLLPAGALAHNGRSEYGGRDHGSPPPPVDLAVIGDIPYGAMRIAAFPANIQQINHDPTVSTVIHVGDIKNGSSRCDTSYFEQIRADFDQFADPLVYTPGDNEWTDCHRGNNGGYQPAGPATTDLPPSQPPQSSTDPDNTVTPADESRLDAVRRIFFPQAGHTLGADRRVISQGDPIRENVLFSEAGIPFATMNVPGSNNDLLPWYGDRETPTLKALQADEYNTRNRADLKWLKTAFQVARSAHAPALVLAIQADMWDPAIEGNSTQYSGFTDFVRALARETLRFGRPVLLLNGDSHFYESDKPLSDPSATNNKIYGIDYAVPNMMRITVDGSNNAKDYLRLHVDPSTAGVFSWQRIPYTTG